ncbi:DNA-3-methyladenine glycosylase I [Fidelibacter multiformis]|uniref:DNA-3-methyladenine glycosylase I n=1 Tax=Fidelibacter multiformis TaxID=3377529 RepID=UPI0037DCBC56
MNNVTRCPWPGKDPLMMTYHDTEWGVPLHDDQGLFEFLILDGFQAGLSWSIVLRKRGAFRQAFDGFDPEKIARYDEEKVQALLQNPEIIRNRRKIDGAIRNARSFLSIREQKGSFNDYIWMFTDGKTIHNHWREESQIPVTSSESDAMSKDLKQHGFSFVGSTICYAFMQAAGLVNDHLISCFRHQELINL